MEESWEAYAQKQKRKALFETDDFFQSYFVEFQSIFIVHFDQMCAEIVRKQEEGTLSAISYLEYTLLYHSFLQRNYVAEVRVYSETWYLDQKQTAIGTLDVSPFFEKLSAWWDGLLSARKRYAGKVKARQVEECIVEALPHFFAYVGSAIRFSILAAVEGEHYKKIQRADQFEINVGRYLGYAESMYKENRRKDPEECKDWFRKRQKYSYMFEDFSGMDFSGEDLSEIDFRYSDLRNTVLKGTDFQDSMLFGTRFGHADMKEADLRYCMLFEADFSGADLRGAKFGRSVGAAGLPGREIWTVVGYQGVNFQNADLRGADFTKTDLSGALFTGAKMEGAVFDREAAEGLCLSEEQRQGIVER